MKNLSDIINRNQNHDVAEASQIGVILSELKSFVNSTPTISTESFTSALMSKASLDNLTRDQLHENAANLKSQLEALESTYALESNTAQHQAAILAGLLSANPEKFIRTEISPSLEAQSTRNHEYNVVTTPLIGDALYERMASMEAYDNRDNRNATIYSIAYNMRAARQDEFGEALFPTVTTAPGNVGFGVTVRLITVYDGVVRQSSGSFQDFNRINIIRALENWEVLRNESTRLYPVYRSTSAQYFTNTTLIANTTKTVGVDTFSTSPLAFGTKLDLLGISQTDTQLSSGSEDETDSIDPHISLENVYVSFTDGTHTDVIMLPTLAIPYSTMTYVPQQNYRLMQLNFKTRAVIISPTTTQVDGAALVALAPLVTNNYTARLEMNITGTINIETGECEMYGVAMNLYLLTDVNGNTVSTATVPGSGIASVIADYTYVGYDLEAWRTNMNRRTRGNILNITYYTQLYTIPLRSPITALHPVTYDLADDQTSLSALITATHIRCSNDAVTQLLTVNQVLAQYASTSSIGPDMEGPELLGVGRYLVVPYYNIQTVDVLSQINSLRSSQRSEDIQGLLINYIRNEAYTMYTNSQYLAASIATNDGTAKIPTVIIGTDPIIARYLTVTGDLRTLGNGFDVKIVSTLDSRVRGSIYITFGDFTSDLHSAPNPLHFGTMAWKPELVITLPISRNGQVSKELTVQPSYLHICNLPILSVISVTNIPNALGTIPVPTHPV